MNEKMHDKEERQGQPASGQTGGCGCSGASPMGKSQDMKEDESTENDIVGASHYERAESDQSTGIFAQQTKAYNRRMDEITGNDDENAKDNLADYMDELKEESEAIGEPRPYGETEGRPEIPAEGKYTPPFNV